MDISTHVRTLLKYLNEGLIGREQEIKLALLAAISGESMFMLGPPGVAKSLIARRMKYIFKNAKSFEHLMSRFSTPEDLFGPISIKKLEEDKYERKVEGYLPDSEVVFLDEIWKASPAIQNSLLTAINEKIYKNGTQILKIKLKLLIAASNELPDKSEGLEAIWDRFLIRTLVKPVNTKEGFINMIMTETYEKDNIPEEYKIDNETHKLWQKQIDNVVIPHDVVEIMFKIREKIYKDLNIYSSDRRWKKIARLLKTSAFLNGRKKVSVIDLFILKYTLWDGTDLKSAEDIEKQINDIENIVNKITQLHIDAQISQYIQIINKINKELENYTTSKKIVVEKVPKVYNIEYKVPADKNNTYKKGNFIKLVKTNIKIPGNNTNYTIDFYIPESEYNRLLKDKKIKTLVFQDNGNYLEEFTAMDIEKDGDLLVVGTSQYYYEAEHKEVMKVAKDFVTQLIKEIEQKEKEIDQIHEEINVSTEYLFLDENAKNNIKSRINQVIESLKQVKNIMNHIKLSV